MIDPARSKNALDALERIKCTVDCLARIHEKIVLIDKQIVWHGSLNVLSHTHRTDESMTRLINTGLADALAANISKRRISAEKALETICDAENPRCRNCGARSVYDEGKDGPYFYCEEECGWSGSSDERTKFSRPKPRAEVTDKRPEAIPTCPLCKGKMKLRKGKHGAFYGCIKFPKCEGTVNVTH
jgi:Topoisomerase DNA binding C4 zinc finger